jgi:tRNA (guanine37-N1)-methyltransferase
VAKLKFQILTIFPELFEQFTKVGLISRGIAEEKLEISAIQLRDFAINKHGQIDDTPFGGGAGMVLRPETAVNAINYAKEKDPTAKVVLLTPRGKPLNQKLAREIFQDCKQNQSGLILLCPRYEGVDQRVVEKAVDLEISIGDYILMGGEIPGMVLIEAIARLVPGILGNPDSSVNESFENFLLEHPQFTKPQEFEGEKVPEVLLSGNHALIAKWQKEQAIKDTISRRPDLAKEKPLTKPKDFFVGLVHYPVEDKQGEIITSSITNLDIHDIGRSAKTYGVDGYYVIHPVKTLRRLADKICEHWASGFGFTYNHNRSDALALVKLTPALDDAISDIEKRTGKLPKLITTSAKKSGKAVTFSEMRTILSYAEEPHLLILGTGWGLSSEVLERADYHLEPIYGPTEYNHLSVRAAAAIFFDRLFG